MENVTPTQLAFAQRSDIDCNGKCNGANKALLRNWGFCGECRQGWWPIYPKPGWKLLDVRSMSKDARKYSCICQTLECIGIGRCGHNCQRLPRCKETRHLWYKSLGISPDDRKETWEEKPNNYAVAGWHFHPSLKIQSKDGTFSLKKGEYVDDKKKVWPCAVPNVGVEAYEQTLPPEVMQACVLKPAHVTRSATKRFATERTESLLAPRKRPKTLQKEKKPHDANVKQGAHLLLSLIQGQSSLPADSRGRWKAKTSAGPKLPQTSPHTSMPA